MRIIQNVMALLCLSATTALACQPPPPGYFENNGFRAVLDSDEVMDKIGYQPILSIQLGRDATYTVTAQSCSLTVHVEAKRERQNAPCGGPFTFQAKVVGGNCR